MNLLIQSVLCMFMLASILPPQSRRKVRRENALMMRGTVDSIRESIVCILRVADVVLDSFVSWYRVDGRSGVELDKSYRIGIIDARNARLFQQ